MEYRRLGQSGLKVSALSIGAMTFGESKTFMRGVTSPDDEARRVFDSALDDGVNLVDTANIYGDGASEELVGKWLREKRGSVLVATKCRFPFALGHGAPAPNEYGLSRKHILEACEASLRRLGVDHIDLYQVHMQDGAVGIDETLRALDDLVRQGKVRYIGCSNFTGYRLVESLWASDRQRTERFASVQLQWSLIVRGAEREVIPACSAFGVGVMVWSPLARGFLSGKYQGGSSPPAGSRLETWQDSWRSMDQERNWNVLRVVQEIAAEHATSPAAISLAWLLSQPTVSTLVVGARTAAQWEDNRRALGCKLKADDLRRLDEASRPEWGYPYDFIGMREPW